MSPDKFIDELWKYTAEVPTAQHPSFDGIESQLGGAGKVWAKVYGDSNSYLLMPKIGLAVPTIKVQFVF